MKRINIGIDGGDYETQKQVESGIQRLVSSFITSVSIQNNYRFHYYFFSQNKNKFHGNRIIYKQLPQTLFSRVFLPLKCFFDRIQIFLAFSGSISPIIRLFSKSIVFIHDFGFYDFPQYYPTFEKLKWQTSYSIFSASKIVVFSDHIRNQLIHKFPLVKRDKIIRIYPGVDHIARFQNKKTDQTPSSFFLYVGVIKKIKNIETLFKLFIQFLNQTGNKKVNLVLIGKKEETYWNILIKSNQYLQCKNNIIFLENVSEKELYFYYKNCIALLNASHAEGICYPVIEALSLNKKVITNNLPLYSEFVSNFPGLFISKTETQFLNAMIEESIKKPITYPVYKNPFRWNLFSKKLLTVIDTLSK